MAFNSSTKKIVTKSLIKTIETKVSGKFTLDDDKIIDRVLDGCGCVNIQEEMVSGDFLQFKGTVNFTTMFTYGDKSLDSETIIVEFQEKTQLLNAEEGVVLIPEIDGYSFNKETNNTVCVTISVKTKIYATTQEELPLIVGEEKGYYTKMEKIKTTSCTSCGKGTIVLTEEIKVNGPVKKVLASSVTSVVNKAEANENYAVVDGSIFATIKYNDGENLKLIQQTIDFNHEVAALNLTKDMMVDALVVPTSVLCDIKEDDGSQKLILDVQCYCAIFGQKEEEFDVIGDVFSDEMNLVVNVSSYNATTFNQIKLDSDRQTIVFDMAGKKRMDEIIYLSDPVCNLEQVQAKDGKGIINGQIKINAIYKNYDSDEILSTMLVNPFSLTVMLEKDEKPILFDAEVSAKCVSYKNKAGKDIGVTIDFDYKSITKTEDVCAYVTKIEEKNKLPEKNYSIKICKPEKGLSVFEIAKSLEISPDVLLAQNPGLEDGTLDKIVVYLKSNK